MPDYRRLLVPGGTYFFTVVTHGRRPIFAEADARTALRRAFSAVKSRFPFEITAFALLPDHLHTVWVLPPGDAGYSTRWGRIKGEFSRSFAHGGDPGRAPSRARHRERPVWQRRFWEHACRDEQDLKRCVDYTHWNPVKHGLVGRVRDYPWSTFHRFVARGEYDIDWGGTDPTPGYSAERFE